MIEFVAPSERFRHLLQQAGWTPERRVDVGAWVDSLRSEGFVPNEFAMKLLANLGGLVVSLPPEGINPYHHELSFDPVLAASGEFDRLEEWRPFLEADLFPLGAETKAHSILWIGSNGAFYLDGVFDLYALGDSFESAMDQLAFPTRPVRSVRE